MPEQIADKLDAGKDVVSATFVTPYPPGFPVLVPGQTFSRQILSYMGSLDTSEVHGMRPDRGYRVYTDKALEIAQTMRPNGRQPSALRRTDGAPAAARPSGCGAARLPHNVKSQRR